MNKGPFLFNNNLIIRIINCFVDNLSYIGSQLYIYNRFSSSFINSLTHYSTFECHAINPLINIPLELTPLINLNPNNSFEKYYPELNYRNVLIHQSSFILIQANNYWIHDSIFIELGSNSGSAININSNTFESKFVIESCLISKCYSTNNGGAIYFEMIYGSIILNKICGYKCFTQLSTSLGHFGYISGGDNLPIEIHLSTITLCSPLLSSGNNVLFLNKGIQKYNFLNLSENYANSFSGLTSNLGKQLFVSYSIIESNVIQLGSSNHLTSSYQIIKNVHILNNSCYNTPDYLILFDSDINSNLFNSIILNNNNFKKTKTSGKITFIECTFDIYNFDLTPFNYKNKILNHFTRISHFYTANCQSYIGTQFIVSNCYLTNQLLQNQILFIPIYLSIL